MKVQIDSSDLEVLVSSSRIVFTAMEEDIRENGGEPSEDHRYVELGISIEHGRKILKDVGLKVSRI